MRRLRSLSLVVAGALACAGLGYGVALTMAPSDADAPPAPTAPVTAEVEQRRITSKAVLRGDAGFTNQLQVTISVVAPVPVVTRAPLAEGDRLEGGELVLEVAGRPVIALPGLLPAYRDLGPDDEGPDVLQLEQALTILGHDPGTVDDTFTLSTSAAVTDLYEGLGYEPLTVGTLGGAPPDDAGAEGGAGDEARGTEDDRGNDVVLPRSEVTYVETLPRRVDESPARLGALVPDKPMLLSGSDLVVSVDLTAADLGTLRAGMRAVVDLPGGPPVNGRLGRMRRTETGGRTEVQLPDLSPARERRVRSANVKVTVPLQSTQGKVLVVPLAALSTDASGVARVVRVDDDGTSDTLEVEVGLAAEGYAEVRPVAGDLASGDRVVVGT